MNRVWLVRTLAVTMLWLAFVGCSRTDPRSRAGASALPGTGTVGLSSAIVHDPSHPPIDCPLRKQGIDPTHLRPFEDVAKYIEFLDRPERKVWQKPDEVVAALGLRGDEVIFDVGAGSGYFSFRWAAALSKGRVVAADTEAEMIRHVHHRAMTEGVENIAVKLIQPSDPGVDATADIVFVCDVLHHVADRPAWLRKVASGMKSGARFALIEFKEGKLPEGPPEGTKIPRAELVTLVTRAGLTLEKEHDGLLPYQVFLVFRKP
jgi:SAM-dependent methyltransferase